MKYIRTKDGVYLNGGKFGNPCVGIVGKKIEIDYGFCFDNKDIVGKSNTLYRLFDEVVIIHEDGEITQYNVVGDECRHKYDPYYNFDIKHIKLYDGLIKGAIWTDKGLIYVAKLSEGGEWKLL